MTGVQTCALPIYAIWPIGRNMVDGYLPFCRLSGKQPFEGARCIETHSLRAVKVEGAQIIMAAARSGFKTVKDFEAFVEKNTNAKEGSWEFLQVQRCTAAIPYIKQVNFD